jgi:hypothetical protein
MEHIDWSQKAWEMKAQEQGFFDVNGSDKFFKVHAEKSSVDNKDQYLKNARSLFDKRSPSVVFPTERSIVRDITYVIPFRDMGRNDSVTTVINNVRAQRFPVINIIMVEQDVKTRANVADLEPIQYHLAQQMQNPLFNKSIAFNLGVNSTKTSKVILHDADMLMQGNYTTEIWEALEKSDACHLGGRVIYSSEESTRLINSTGVVNADAECDRVVGYFEGGSLACKISQYWKCGAFNEDFWGYGCEDCDFYARLSGLNVWTEKRTFDLLHLWHPRVQGWNDHHNKNKAIESSLKSLPLPDRINKQYNQLRNNGYFETLNRYLGESL